MAKKSYLIFWCNQPTNDGEYHFKRKRQRNAHSQTQSRKMIQIEKLFLLLSYSITRMKQLVSKNIKEVFITYIRELLSFYFKRIPVGFGSIYGLV